MTDRDPLLAGLSQGRERFLDLVASIRPELHRYCARMTGSVADGEDVVQETLARAYYALSELTEVPPLRPWLFRIAHHRALDYLRRYDVRMSESPEVLELIEDDFGDPEDALERQQAVRAAVSRFMQLPPVQRSCVILKDVLDHSLAEIASLLSISVLAVKAALHRGRAQLHEADESSPGVARARLPESSPVVLRYVALFNARDWDGVRAMLAEDVRLHVISRAQRTGPRAVEGYFSNYDRFTDWHLVPAWLEEREVIAALRSPQDTQASYFIELTVRNGTVAAIRDFRYVPYIAEEAAIELGGKPSS